MNYSRADLRQFIRFVVTGVLNTAIDFFVLYLLIRLSRYSTGVYYSVFKGMSFTLATVNSYLLNKFWTFGAGRSGGGVGEAGRFIAVALVSLVVNITTASIVVALDPLGGISATLWALVGAAAGSGASLIFSFVGFRLFVFSKK